MKKFDYTFREGLPGGPNEVKGRVKGSVTKSGYKRNSPDVDNDFNVIPSPYITMVGVDFPVYGEDNLGNGQMMYPGENYEFPGDYVTEMPAYGSGGLTQWFAEEWVDVKTGKKCGRSGKDKNGRPYPACRPSKRVNKTTPKTIKEMSAKEKAKLKKSKTSKKRINYNHKRAQFGGGSGDVFQEVDTYIKPGQKIRPNWAQTPNAVTNYTFGKNLIDDESRFSLGLQGTDIFDEIKYRADAIGSVGVGLGNRKGKGFRPAGENLRAGLRGQASWQGIPGNVIENMLGRRSGLDWRGSVEGEAGVSYANGAVRPYMSIMPQTNVFLNDNLSLGIGYEMRGRYDKNFDQPLSGNTDTGTRAPVSQRDAYSGMGRGAGRLSLNYDLGNGDFIEGYYAKPDPLYQGSMPVPGVPEVMALESEGPRFGVRLRKSFKKGGELPKAQDGKKIAEVANQMVLNGEDGTRPPLNLIDNMVALFDKDGVCRDNTCVNVVKDIYKRAGYDVIPEGVYNNRAFKDDYDSYGLQLVAPQNKGRYILDDLQPGDIIQYRHDANSRGALGKEGYPFHLGVYDENGQYISDGSKDDPIKKQSVFYYDDGTSKPPFDVFRLKELGGSVPKAQEGGENKDAMRGMMKARIALENEFGNNPAVQRLIVPTDNPYQFDNGDTGTHYMSSAGKHAIPYIQEVDGKLQMTDGYRMNEAIRFDRDEDAEYFAAENYKKVAPAFKKQDGGPAGTYSVKPGDTFYGIANRQGVDKNALVNANPDLDIDNLKVGQSIQLPGMNPNYVLSNKGVVSMFPEAYSTVSDGYKGQSFIDDALAKSQPKLSGYLDMDNTLKYLTQSRGNTADFWTNTADTIAYHESAHTMNPKMKQHDDGPARGMFQFEGPAFQTFKNRYRNVANVLNLKTDPEILNAKSADELPANKQYTAFLVNLLESGAVLKDYADGNISIEDLWLTGHKNKEVEGNRESFNASSQKAKRKGIRGGYQDVKKIGGEKEFDPSIFNTNPELTKSFEKIVTSFPQATMQAAPSPEEAFAEMPVFDNNTIRKSYLDQANVSETTGLDPRPTPLEKQFFEKEGAQEALTLQEKEYQAPDLFTNYANNVNSQSREEFDAINNKYYKKYTVANKPAVAEIQQSLVQQGYLQPDQVDGFFGPLTKKALKASRNQTTIDSDLIPSTLSDARCAAGMCSMLDSQGINTAGLGLKYKNAWDILESTQEKGTADVVYNIYDNDVFNGVESASDIKRATVQAKRQSQTTPDMYSVGDVVGIYWPNSTHHAETKNSKTHNTHVGFVSEIRNGIPIITHNLAGTVKQDPYNKLVTGWISRPNGAEQVKSQYSPKDWDKTGLRPEVLENWKAKTEVSDPDPERFKTVENVLKRVNYNANALPQRLGSNVDPNWLRDAVSGVLGNESAVGYNAKRSRQEVEESDRLRAVAYKVKDIDDGDISIGVGKIKFSQLDPFAKSFFDVKSPEDLGNDVKNVDVTTYNMIKHYDMFADYASKFPELGLTESDVRNMSILSHNQGSSRLLKLGRNADFKTVEEEVQSLRNLYDSEISDISSTNWKYFGNTLGNLGLKAEGLIKGNDPSFETYISKGNRWGKWLYDRDPNSINENKNTPTLYDYMKSNSIDATYNNRRKLYESYLKEDYKGTAEQNNKLLIFLQHLNSSDFSLAINTP